MLGEVGAGPASAHDRRWRWGRLTSCPDPGRGSAAANRPGADRTPRLLYQDRRPDRPGSADRLRRLPELVTL